MKKYIYLVSLILLIGCQPKVFTPATITDYSSKVNTTDHPIEIQVKKTYLINGVYADNQFDGARMNHFAQLNDSTWQVYIEPENEPINESPWYAFKLWSATPKTIHLELKYKEVKHRYYPKISTDRKNWTSLPKAQFTKLDDSTKVVLKLNISADTTWIAAQELITSTDVKTWCTQQATHKDVKFEIAGKSKLGRDLYYLDVGNKKKKDIIVLLSRQHPPEVTGFLAFQAFVETLLEDTPEAIAFRKKYRILMFPLMNPDGVDMGHWRHNAGGIDLNRDWAYYHQPETRVMTTHVLTEAKRNKSRVILGLDFHSTWADVYYTNSAHKYSVLPNFKEDWLRSIEALIPDYKVNEKPFSPTSPISKNWFFRTFKADAVTYEIGDETNRNFIKKKGAAAAKAMMKVLK